MAAVARRDTPRVRGANGGAASGVVFIGLLRSNYHQARPPRLPERRAGVPKPVNLLGTKPLLLPGQLAGEDRDGLAAVAVERALADAAPGHDLLVRPVEDVR